jgi:accessory gene regulator B
MVLNKDKFFSTTQLDEINYSIQTILSDFSKFLLLLILFKITNFEYIYLYSFFVTTILHIFVGGFHFNNYYSCLIFSVIYYITLIICHMFFSDIIITILLLIFTPTLLFLSPQIPLKTKRNCKIDKNVIKLIILFIIGVYIFLYSENLNSLSSINALTIIFQSIQLLYTKGTSYIISNYRYSNKKT